VSKGTILVVEPDDDIREWIDSALVADGYKVWVVDSAEKGMSLVGEIEPDLLLLDNRYDKIQWDDAYTDFQYKNIPQIWMYREQFRFDQIGEIIPQIPQDSIQKAPIDEIDRVKLRNTSLSYRQKPVKKDVWIVSPNEEIREMLRIYLSDKGFAVKAFAYATRAFVELQRVHQPDILLMWNNIPIYHQLNGAIDYENRALYDYCNLDKIPFLFICQIPDDFRWSYPDMELGPNLNEMFMPFDIEELRTRVEFLLNSFG
jgi:CheY-like chemotaxis protein